MCSNFIHDYDIRLLNTIEQSLGPNNFFLVCEEPFNYFYTSIPESFRRLQKVMLEKHILLHALSEMDMRIVLQVRGISLLSVVAGNHSMFNAFITNSLKSRKKHCL